MKIKGRLLSFDEVIELVKGHIQYLTEFNELEGLKFKPSSFLIYGSRSNGTYTEESDLDIIMEYKGYAREDDLFNALHGHNTLFIEGIAVDINPKKVNS